MRLNLLLFFLIANAAWGSVIWIEGEAPASSTMHRHPWWYDQVKKDLLSGGDWISNFSDKEAGEAGYEVAVEKAGDFILWVRANPVQAGVSYRIGAAGAWTPVDLSRDVRGQQNVAADSKPDLRFIGWVKVGTVKLAAGKNTVAFRFDGKASHHGALDCFVLTDEPFSPQGITKPLSGGAGGRPDEWFPLMVDEDPLSPESVIDMSRRIEAPAGKHGPIIANGKDLVFADAPDRPVKLWGCNANLESGRYTRGQLTRRAGYLRKFGINAVREHPLFDEVSTDGKLDAKKLAEYDWWFAELKKNGIYTVWSVFYHFPIRVTDGYEPGLFQELPEMGSGGLRDSYGLITIAPELWKLRTTVLLELLRHRNPHTGLRYCDDPALATVEMQNEDSVFFWNPLGELANPGAKKWPKHARKLRQLFAAWAKEQYRTDEALKAAWGGLEAGESLAAGELRALGPWELDMEGPRGALAGKTRRAGDYVRFLTGLQRGLYSDCEKAIRGTGFRGQTVTTNWLSGSPAADPANIFSDTVGSLIDRHNYAGGGAGGHGIGEGAIYADSHLGKPGAYLFGIGLKQVENKPFSLSEWTMCPPNEWKAECAPIMAFYGMGLQGWDASFHFAQSGTRIDDGWPRVSSYATDTPHYIGQFPALALALFRGDIAESPEFAARRVAEDDLYSGKGPVRQDYYDGEQFKSGGPGATPAEVFAMGRVTMSFSGGRSVTPDVAKFWNRGSKTIRSVTGQLDWDYGREVITVSAPRTHAIVGRPGTAKIGLPALSAEVKTPFVSLICTSLDDAPLAESRHILVTALARDKQAGAKYSADGKRLEAVGTAPLLLEPVQATLQFAGPPPKAVRPLDPYGAPLKTKPVTVQPDGRFTIDGTFRSYYYEIIR